MIVDLSKLSMCLDTTGHSDDLLSPPTASGPTCHTHHSIFLSCSLPFFSSARRRKQKGQVRTATKVGRRYPRKQRWVLQWGRGPGCGAVVTRGRGLWREARSGWDGVRGERVSGSRSSVDGGGSVFRLFVCSYDLRMRLGYIHKMEGQTLWNSLLRETCLVPTLNLFRGF